VHSTPEQGAVIEATIPLDEPRLGHDPVTS
jgi:hypothetical protein